MTDKPSIDFEYTPWSSKELLQIHLGRKLRY